MGGTVAECVTRLGAFTRKFVCGWSVLDHWLPCCPARAAGTRKPGRRRGSRRGGAGCAGRAAPGARGELRRVRGASCAGCAGRAAPGARGELLPLRSRDCERWAPAGLRFPARSRRRSLLPSAGPGAAGGRGDVNRGPRARPDRRDVAQARGGAAEERPEALGDPEEQLLLHPSAAPRARRGGRSSHRLYKTLQQVGEATSFQDCILHVFQQSIFLPEMGVNIGKRGAKRQGERKRKRGMARGGRGGAHNCEAVRTASSAWEPASLNLYSYLKCHIFSRIFPDHPGETATPIHTPKGLSDEFRMSRKVKKRNVNSLSLCQTPPFKVAQGSELTGN
ncbi:uncharacterized protein LOC144249836 [Urocitellus parryii]